MRPTAMNKTSLSKLTRAELQAVAKDNGLRANGKTESIVQELLALKHANFDRILATQGGAGKDELKRQKVARRMGFIPKAPVVVRTKVAKGRQQSGRKEPSKNPKTKSRRKPTKPEEHTQERVEDASGRSASEAKSKSQTLQEPLADTRAREDNRVLQSTSRLVSRKQPKTTESNYLEDLEEEDEVIAMTSIDNIVLDFDYDNHSESSKPVSKGKRKAPESDLGSPRKRRRVESSKC